jgi:hypothetical protein
MVILAIVPIAGCQDPAEPTSPSAHVAMRHGSSGGNVRLSKDVRRKINQLRKVTARFHRFDAAVAAGWSAPIPSCFTDETLGAMGYHYANESLIDDKVNELEPELLLYEPQKNGKLRFVAVEYIVPWDLWTSPEPPMLYGQSFHRNETFKLWVLHVWHVRKNPSGIFTDWNPNVSCKYATPER